MVAALFCRRTRRNDSSTGPWASCSPPKRAPDPSAGQPAKEGRPYYPSRHRGVVRFGKERRSISRSLEPLPASDVTECDDREEWVTNGAFCGRGKRRWGCTAWVSPGGCEEGICQTHGRFRRFRTCHPVEGLRRVTWTNGIYHVLWTGWMSRRFRPVSQRCHNEAGRWRPVGDREPNGGCPPTRK